MVAIVTGNGLGLERSSGLVLGSRGQLGTAAFGRYGENVSVNAATGNLLIGRTDEILIGQGPDSAISRAYNSLGATSGLGTNDNWQLNTQRHVTGLTGTVNTSGSTITLIDWDGSDVVYTYDTTSGVYANKEGSGAYDTLSFASNVWTWTDGDTRTVDSFDSLNGGRITSSKDTDNNTLTYSYTSGLLTRVTTTDGGSNVEHIDLTWSGNNLTQITTTKADSSTLTRTRYTYDASNRLSTVITDLTPGDNSVTDGATIVTTYTYDGTSSRVASIAQTGGALLSITYDGSGRVASLAQTLASGVTNTTTFSYNMTTRVTTITDQAGQVTTLSYDASGQLTQIVLPAAQSGASQQTSSFTYNGNGDVLTATDTSGNVTTYDYDANGNVTLVRDQAGNTIARAYDSANHLLTETGYLTPDPDGSGSGTASNSFTTRYAYDSTGHLRFSVSALGEVTEYTYNSVGQRMAAIAYRGNSYSLSGLSDTTSISESALATWASGISDKSGVLRSDTSYDFRGNISTVTSYTQAATSGAGLTTATYTVLTYTYDQYGNLLTRHTSGIANTEVFTYDGLGRVVSSTDLNGSTTSVAFTDSLNKAIATLGNGLVKTSIYNLAGELISYAESGSGITTGTTSNTYDNLGRLRMVTDAVGNTSYYLYDNVGRKVADIAADGSITEYRYDASNRLISSTSYATKLTGTQLSSLVSGGAPTSVALSTIRPAADAADVWNWRIYDTANRLIETIDGDGDAVIFAYDGASNLVSTTGYSNVLSSSALTGFKTTAPTTLQTPSAGNDTVTRNFYDSDNRLIGTLDGNGYLQQIVYNEAGEKIETIAYATTTVSGHRVSGSFATLLADVGTSSADIHARYVYDGEGHLKYTLDNNLRPTEYVYDSAGRVLHTISYAAPIVSAPSSYTVASVAAQIAATSGLATNVDNRITWAVYDAAGRAAYTIDADGGVTSFTYDSIGEAVKQVAYATLNAVTADPSLSTMNSWATSHASDTGNRVIRALYDQAGRVVYAVDAEGYVTENRYDADGRVTLSIRYATAYTVTDSFTLASVATSIGSIPSTAVQTSFTYDVDGRVSDSYDGAGVRTHYVYDALGRVQDKTLAYGTGDAVTKHYGYDAAGRSISVTNAYGTSEATTSSCTYDGLGNQITETDGRGYVTTYTYDHLGQALTVITPIDGSTSATTTNVYNAFGNVIQSTDARGNNAYFFYDGLDRLTYQIDQEGYVTKVDYTIGNETAKTTRYVIRVTAAITAGTLPTITADTAHDEITTYTHNLLGQVTKITDAEGYYEQYTLDAFGNQTAVRNKLAGITTNSFDRRGQLVSQTLAETSVRSDGTTEASSVTTTFQYDSRGNRTQMVEAAGLAEARTTSYTYDKLDRLLTTIGDAVTVVANDLLTTSSVTPTTANVYDNRGNLIQTTDPVGAKTLFYYDHLNRQIATVDAVGTLSTRTYDANGNVTSQKVYGDAITIPSAPSASVPAPVSGTNYRETLYAYDRANRLITTTTANVQYGEYSGSAFTQGTADIVVTTTYDASGNIISQQDGRGNSVYYYYDKRGGQIAQVDQGNYLTAYALDADGNITKQEQFATALSATPSASSNPATLRSSVAGNANDRITNSAYDRNGRLLSQSRTGVTAWTVNSSGTLAAAATTATISYTYNGLGEVLTTTEATGDQTATIYDSFGRQTSVSGQAFTDYTGATVTPTAVTSYDGLNNVTRAVTNSTIINTNSYGAGGRLASTTDADGFAVTYGYDAAGRVVKQSYTREKSDNIAGVTTSTVTEAKAMRYDALGRAVYQSTATWNGTSWAFGDYVQTRYDTFGEITAKGDNGLFQEATSYDNAGRAWKSTAGDGVTRIYYYDKTGNQSLMVTSDGNALPAGYDWSTLTIAQINTLETAGSVAFGSAAVAGMVLTFNTYDVRGQNISTVDPLRKIDRTTTTHTITTQHAYNAFGEVISDTDARSNVTNYTYNTLGKLTQTQAPSVSVTAENGAISSVAPLQKNYYDLSGRLVAVEDANGNINKRFLLAGTGYGSADALVVKEFHPDSGVKTYGFDVFGNQRKATDELGNVSLMDYDAMGRLMTVTHPTRAVGSVGNLSGSSQTLVDYYAYDGLGQRIRHWNNMYSNLQIVHHYVTEYDYTSTETGHTYTTDEAHYYTDDPAHYYTTDPAHYYTNDEAHYYTNELAYYQTTELGSYYTSDLAYYTNTVYVPRGETDWDGNYCSYVYIDTSYYYTEQVPYYYDQIHYYYYTVDHPYYYTQDHLYYVTTDHLYYVTTDHLYYVHTDHLYYVTTDHPYTYYVDHYHDVDHPYYVYANTDRTDYDAEGRVVSTYDMAGNHTTESYAWSSTLSTDLAGGGSLGTFGGWTKTTTAASGLTSTDTVDYFNRATTETDFGGNTSTSTYNRAGELARNAISSSEHLDYVYYNTGMLASIDDISDVTALGATNYSSAISASDSIVYSTTTNPVNHPGYGYYDVAFEYVSSIETQHNDTTHYYTVRTDTYSQDHRYTEFEYDVAGNRTYEGVSLSSTATSTTYYNDHLATNVTYHFNSDDWQYGITRHSHDNPVETPVYGTRPDGTYHSEWVNDPYYSYTDSYGTSFITWTVDDGMVPATTYYTYYTDTWVEGYSYYDWSTSYTGYVDGHYESTPQVGTYTYYYHGYHTAYGYAPPGHYEAVANYESYIDHYDTSYYATYTDDAYSTHTPTNSTGTGAPITADTATTTTTGPVTTTVWLERETVAYDAMNRVTSIHDDGYNLAAPTTITMEYDANGNVRRRDALYRAIDLTGNVASTDSEQDNWYKYDSMNRFVTTKGTFSGTRGSGTISRAIDGIDLAYDAAGNRATATTTIAGGTVRQEQYSYTADGFLALTKLSVNGGTAGTLAAYGLDAMGRATSYKEYDTSGTNTYTRTATYDQISQVTHDDTVTLRTGETDYTSTDYSYVAQAGTAAGVAVGKYMGALVHSDTTSSHTPTGGANVSDPTTHFTNTYVMRDSAMMSTSTYQPDASTSYVTNYYYDGLGKLKQVAINDGQPRTVNYITNVMGEVMKRDVIYRAGTPGPHELHYYLAGMAIGDVTNNGTSNTDYVTTIAARTAAEGYGPFRNGATTSTSYADFDQSYDPINGSGGTQTSYVARQGDTLQSIARQLWGDANLWYLIAQANGLNATSVIPAGMSIIIPANVHNFHNNASTFKVYDPNNGIGNVSPTLRAAPEIAQQLNDTGWVDLVQNFLDSSFAAQASEINSAMATARAQTDAAIAAAQAAAAAAAAAAQAAAEAAAAAAAAAAQPHYANSWEQYKAESNPQKTFNDMVAAGYDAGAALSIIRAYSYFGSFSHPAIMAVQNNMEVRGEAPLTLTRAIWTGQGFDWWGNPQGWEPTADDIAFHDRLMAMTPGGGDEIVQASQNEGRELGEGGAFLESPMEMFSLAATYGQAAPAVINSGWVQLSGSGAGSTSQASQTPDSVKLSPSEVADIMKTVTSLPDQSASGGSEWASADTTGATVQTIPVTVAELPAIPGWTSYSSSDLQLGSDHYGYMGGTASAQGVESVTVNAQGMPSVWSGIAGLASGLIGIGSAQAQTRNNNVLVQPSALPTDLQDYLREQTWSNPTGGALRGIDGGGNGAFGSRRHDRNGLVSEHGGADWVSTPGQNVGAPVSGTIDHIIHYGDFEGVSINIGRGVKVEVLYVDPTVARGAYVAAGQVIGTSANLAPHYGDAMTNHNHVQIRGPNQTVIDPTGLIPHN
jgi:YD repeat-containing protein